MTINDALFLAQDETPTSLMYTAKAGVTWKQITKWLQTEFKDYPGIRWDWRGFGNEGEEGFKVVVVKKRSWGDISYEEDSDTDDE